MTRDFSDRMIVAGRFELEAEFPQVRQGPEQGVYRARDRDRHDRPIALRLLRAAPNTPEAESFLQAARGLVTLAHPGFETHVAHGRIAEAARPGPWGEWLFLATEWIEGVVLAERLRNRPLRAGETLALARAIAQALAVAHRQGLADGHLRPNRLLLTPSPLSPGPSTPPSQEETPERVVLLGFGMVPCHPTWGASLDSPPLREALRYLAPEQARGQVGRSPSADMFSLGCVLFECLAGIPPFGGLHAAGVLAQILFQEVPSLGQLRPELPGALTQLVGRMLAKPPEARPTDGQAVAETLAQIELTPAQSGLAPGAPAVMLAVGEPKLLCLVLARPQSAASVAGEAGPEEALAGHLGVPGRPMARPTGSPLPFMPPLSPGALEDLRNYLNGQVGDQGGRIDQLADGALVALLSQGEQTMMAVVTQAARLALALRVWLSAPHLAPLRWELGLGIGRGAASGTPPLDEALSRALELLPAPTDPRNEDGSPPRSGDGGGDRGPWLDPWAARLLDLRFHVHPTASGRALLLGERSGREEVRPLLGTVTPCLGRERELDLLQRWLEDSIDESTAQALLVTAPAGMGKSRLRQEFVRRLAERGTKVAIWLGRGDPMRVGTTYWILGQALRELCGPDGANAPWALDTPGTQTMTGTGDASAPQARLHERVGRYLPPHERLAVVEFLGELCGWPFPDGESARLRAARQDPRLMGEHVTTAFIRFLEAECAHQPVLLILEDLHWSDAATLRLLEVALKKLAERPLAVLGLARPEVKEMYPRLWGEEHTQELQLTGLGRKASIELVERVLRGRITTGMAERIALQAGNNALFLEELIRSVAEGREGELPETVLAILQERYAQFPWMARQFVRMASLFGDTFPSEGVRALLGGKRHEREIERAIGVLMGDEVLVFRGENRATGATHATSVTGATSDRLFAFRHSLLRDAAYGLMSEKDRRLGHRLAAAYLERTGESNPAVLAAHFQRGGRPDRAAHHYARAAQQALATNDLEGAMARVAQGVACGARGELLGTLCSIETWAHLWRGNFAAADQAMQTALAFLPAGSAEWISLQGAAVALLGLAGQRVRVGEHLELLSATPLLPGAKSAFLEPAMMAVTFASLLGMPALAALFLERLRELYSESDQPDPRARGMHEFGRLWHGLLLAGDVWTYTVAARGAAHSFAEAGDRRNSHTTRSHSGIGLILLGEVEQGLAICREMIDVFTRHGEPMGQLATQALCAFALAETGDPRDLTRLKEARGLAEEAIAYPHLPGFWYGMAHVALAIVLADGGAFEAAGAAEAAARQALRILHGAPTGRPLACAVLGQLLLRQGRYEEAEMAVKEGLAQLTAQGGAGLFDTKLHLAAAEVWHALGQETAAKSAFAATRRTLTQHTARMDDSETRERFLAHSREHARLAELGQLASEIHPRPTDKGRP